jgi:GTP-binding protein
VDLSAEGAAAEEVGTIEEELRRFNPQLLERPRILVGTKLDAVREERRRDLESAAADRGLGFLAISAVGHDGVDRLVGEVAGLLRREATAEEEE